MREALCWNIIVVIVLVMLSGCATPTHIKAYPGPELPRDQIALLKPTVGIRILEMDKDKAYAIKTAQPIGYLDVELAISAGDHSIVVMLDQGDQWSEGSIVLNFSATAGRKYLISYTQTREKVATGLLGNRRFEFRPRIEDVTDNPARWCPLASSSNFTGCK